MSRIGKKPIPLTPGATISLKGRELSVSGKQGTLTLNHHPEVSVRVDEAAGEVLVERADDSRTARAMHGLTRTLISNMIKGVTEGYTRELEVNGVGWGAKLQGKEVHLNVGYADTRKVTVPDEVKVEIAGNRIKVSGIDKQLVGQVAAQIRSHRKPEPYNGKGVKYIEETIIRKAGKAFGG